MIRIDKKSKPNRTIIDIKKMKLNGVVVAGHFSNTKVGRKLEEQMFEDKYVIVYLDKGLQHYIVNGKEVILQNQEILIIRPKEIYSTGIYSEDRNKIYWIIGDIFFDDFLGSSKAIGNNIIRLILQGNARKKYSSNKKFVDSLKSIFKIYKENKNNLDDDIIKLEIRSTLLQCFLELTKIVSPSYLGEKDHDMSITKAQKYIDKYIYTDLNLKDISSNIAYMSIPHFYRRFKEVTGYPPKDYINLKKIDKAKELLAQDKLSITQIAIDLGFSTSQYFSTVFKRYTKISPTDYKTSL